MNFHKKNHLKKTSVIVDAHLDFEFKKIASRKYQFQKGWYSNAIAEAMELWIKANEMIFFKKGVNPMTRYIGSKMWDYFNDDTYNDYNSKIDTMDHIFDYFKDTPYLKNVQYKIFNDKFSCCIKSANDVNDALFEEIVDSHIIPLSMVTRAGIEDITGEKYKISKITIDTEESKINLARAIE